MEFFVVVEKSLFPSLSRNLVTLCFLNLCLSEMWALGVLFFILLYRNVVLPFLLNFPSCFDIVEMVSWCHFQVRVVVLWFFLRFNYFISDWEFTLCKFVFNVHVLLVIRFCSLLTKISHALFMGIFFSRTLQYSLSKLPLISQWMYLIFFQLCWLGL